MRERGEERPDFEPVGDEDVPGCIALIRAVLLRAIHDACGATCAAASPANRLRMATTAWEWLHDGFGLNRQSRDRLCEQAGYEPEAFDLQVKKADIPRPTLETVRHAATYVERAYWGMNGRVGPEPVMAERGPLQPRATTRAGRKAQVQSRLLTNRWDARVAGNGRRISMAQSVANLPGASDIRHVDVIGGEGGRGASFTEATTGDLTWSRDGELIGARGPRSLDYYDRAL